MLQYETEQVEQFLDWVEKTSGKDVRRLCKARIDRLDKDESFDPEALYWGAYCKSHGKKMELVDEMGGVAFNSDLTLE